jgi:thiol-disulfide isomerase/thioredoxin
MKTFSLYIFAFLFAFNACAQLEKPGHEIKFLISDMPNEKIVLAYHMSGKHFISDTIVTNSKGEATLKGDEKKKKGIYLAVFPSLENKHFEFILGNNQHFTVSTKVADLSKNLSFNNSKENTFFYEDIERMNTTRKEVENLKTQIDKAEGAKKEELQTKFNKVNKDFLESRLKIINENPNMFYSKLLNMLREIEIPEAPKNEAGESEPNFAFHYFRNHYWNYTDFSEEGILRTPVFHQKLIDYFEKYTVPAPDSLIVSCDIVLALAEKNSEVYKYTLATLLNKYANSKIMGHDALYVHLVQEYYSKGKAPWTDPEQLKKMEERANAMAPLLLGKVSPDLILRDTTTKVKHRLHDIPHDYTIVYIWDPECGHCKKSAPVLNDFINRHPNESIVVYGISTVSIEHIDKWKKFVHEKQLKWINVADLYYETQFRKLYDISSTPQLFVLDKDKKIIAKKLGVEQLEDFFHNYLKSKDDPRYSKFEVEKKAE